MRRSYARRRDAVMAQKARRKIEKAGGREKPETCDVCNRPSWRITFDHCHTSGKFRGWLCYSCNITLGHIEDDPKILRALAEYLENGTSAKLNG